MKRDIYVARQPIFNHDMSLHGYELLYRQDSENNYEELVDEASTISLISDTVLIFGFNQLIDNTKGFVNFSEALLENDIALLLPKEKAVIEIVQDIQLTESILKACESLKSLGYTLALDNVVTDGRVATDKDSLQYKLITLADIIKIEFKEERIEYYRQLIQKYSGQKTFLIKKVETAAQHQMAIDLGFDLFQGNFSNSPDIVKARDIQSLDVNLVRLIEELRKPDPDLKTAAQIIEMDLGLSYKLLRMANSVAYGTKMPIKSIHQAVVHLGTKEVSRWANLIFLKGFQHKENSETIKISLVRGKLMSLLAVESHDKNAESDCFITGIFSFIDLLLGRNMESIVSEMPFTDGVKDALRGTKNQVRKMLDIVIAFELAAFEEWSRILEEMKISRERFMELYLEALAWQQTLPS